MNEGHCLNPCHHSPIRNSKCIKLPFVYMIYECMILTEMARWYLCYDPFCWPQNTMHTKSTIKATDSTISTVLYYCPLYFCIVTLHKCLNIQTMLSLDISTNSSALGINTFCLLLTFILRFDCSLLICPHCSLIKDLWGQFQVDLLACLG